MRDNYVGDIGDFYKYGYLRHLCCHNEFSVDSLKLGIVWYLFPDPCKPSDGLKDKYLSEPLKFQSLDEPLYNKLKHIRETRHLAVSSVEFYEVFPPTTAYFAAPLSLSHLRKGFPRFIQERKAHRNKWLEGALECTQDCDIVFLDPDNGLEVKSTAAHHDKGAKFAFFDEVEAFLQRGQSVVIYQHKNLHQTAAVQIRERYQQLQNALGTVTIRHVYFSKEGGRIFFLIAQERHQNALLKRHENFMVKWKNHLNLVA